jgi:CheY-like chemotaxis protein
VVHPFFAPIPLGIWVTSAFTHTYPFLSLNRSFGSRSLITWTLRYAWLRAVVTLGSCGLPAPGPMGNLLVSGPVLCSGRPSVADRSSCAGAMSEMASARILVVDDDQVIQQLLKVNLELEGYEVEVASDGEEALLSYGAFQPNLVLLDIMMPKLDGWEVSRRLKEGPGGGSVPIVLLSARAQDSDVRRGSEIGVAAYVTKPFDPIALLELVADLLAHRRYQGATPRLT